MQKFPQKTLKNYSRNYRIVFNEISSEIPPEILYEFDLKNSQGIGPKPFSALGIFSEKPTRTPYGFLL